MLSAQINMRGVPVLFIPCQLADPSIGIERARRVIGVVWVVYAVRLGRLRLPPMERLLDRECDGIRLNALSRNRVGHCQHQWYRIPGGHRGWDLNVNLVQSD